MESDLDDLLIQVWRHFIRDETDEAIALLLPAVDHNPHNGRLWYVLGCVMERAKRYRNADRAFRRGSRAREERQPLPYRVGWPRFERLVVAAADSLDTTYRQALEEADLVLADHPKPGLVLREEDPEPLGYFLGKRRDDLTEQDDRPVIHLYRRAMEHRAENLGGIEELLSRTLQAQLRIYLDEEVDEDADENDDDD